MTVRREELDVHGYPCAPRIIKKYGESVWYYEQRGGIDLVQEVPASRTEAVFTVLLPWKDLCAAVDRHRKIQKRRKRSR